MSDGAALRVMIVAGEPSGDALGAALIRALRERTGGRVEFSGLGGERMAMEGFRTLFPIDELAVMGLVEVLPRARRIFQRLNQISAAIALNPPDILVTIDSPGFTLRLARRFPKEARQFPIVHYVAPTVWAWRPKRAARLAQLVDHLMCLLPFEPPYFEAEKLPATFVGHPAVETIAEARRVAEAEAARGEGFRRRNDIPPEAPLLALLPGSRRGEVARLLPVFLATLQKIRTEIPDLRVAIPAVPGMAPMILTGIAAYDGPVSVVSAPMERYQAMLTADLALAASGTATLELGLAGTPTVLAYKVNAITGAIIRRLIRTPYAGLVNVIVGREAMPEFLQANCRADKLAPALLKLLKDPAAREAQLAACAEAGRKLGQGRDPAPSALAAETVLKVLAQHPRVATLPPA